MFAVIFEVQPKAERFQEYLDLAARLRPELERVDGFVANERFTSVAARGRILSLSIWRDEKSLVRWRTLGVHHAAQVAGREKIFADYHLRVGEIIADTGLARTLEQQRLDATEVGAAKAVSITKAHADVPSLRQTPGPIGQEVFAGITDADNRVLLAGWRDEEAALRWLPPQGVCVIGLSGSFVTMEWRTGARRRSIIRRPTYRPRRNLPQWSLEFSPPRMAPAQRAGLAPLRRGSCVV
jgi:heme-degrading monooxygenase HmoA